MHRRLRFSLGQVVCQLSIVRIHRTYADPARKGLPSFAAGTRPFGYENAAIGRHYTEVLTIGDNLSSGACSATLWRRFLAVAMWWH
jgi:hypothetical protein